MKKILFLTSYPSPYRVNFFDELGLLAEVTVLFSDRKEEQGHRSRDWFVEGRGNFRAVQLEKSIWGKDGRLLCTDVIPWLKQKWDAVILCGYSGPTNVLAMKYLQLHRIPYYLEVDGGIIRPDSRLKYRIKKNLVSGASGRLGTGEYTKKYLCHYGAEENRVFTYPFTSLYPEDILKDMVSQEEKQALRRELSMEEPKVILAIGQFIRRKGFDILLQAAARLPEDVGIYIVGGLPTEEYLKMHQELGLTHVHFAGFKKKDELLKYYKASDLFVLPTREDIWGLVVGEAMACGLPVITTDRCVAGLELIQDGVSGYLVPAEDPQALADRIGDAFAGDLQAMGRAALQKIRPYTLQNMAKAHMDILEGRR